VVSVLGDTPYLSTLVPGAAELRLSECGASPAGSRTVTLPMVFRGLVGAEATASFYKTIMRFGIERLKIPDEFQVLWSPEEG
jgi:hypothetical protein